MCCSGHRVVIDGDIYKAESAEEQAMPSPHLSHGLLCNTSKQLLEIELRNLSWVRKCLHMKKEGKSCLSLEIRGWKEKMDPGTYIPRRMSFI